MSTASKVIARTDRQTDRHTDKQTHTDRHTDDENITSAAYAAGNNVQIYLDAPHYAQNLP